MSPNNIKGKKSTCDILNAVGDQFTSYMHDKLLLKQGVERR